MQISVEADLAPATDAHINVWTLPPGGAWTAVVGLQIVVLAGAKRGKTTTVVSLQEGERIAFELDGADALWSLGQGGVSITGLRAKRF